MSAGAKQRELSEQELQLVLVFLDMMYGDIVKESIACRDAAVAMLEDEDVSLLIVQLVKQMELGHFKRQQEKKNRAGKMTASSSVPVTPILCATSLYGCRSTLLTAPDLLKQSSGMRKETHGVVAKTKELCEGDDMLQATNERCDEVLTILSSLSTSKASGGGAASSSNLIMTLVGYLGDICRDLLEFHAGPATGASSNSTATSVLGPLPHGGQWKPHRVASYGEGEAAAAAAANQELPSQLDISSIHSNTQQQQQQNPAIEEHFEAAVESMDDITQKIESEFSFGFSGKNNGKDQQQDKPAAEADAFSQHEQVDLSPASKVVRKWGGVPPPKVDTTQQPGGSQSTNNKKKPSLWPTGAARRHMQSSQTGGNPFERSITELLWGAIDEAPSASKFRAATQTQQGREADDDDALPGKKKKRELSNRPHERGQEEEGEDDSMLPPSEEYVPPQNAGAGAGGGRNNRRLMFIPPEESLTQELGGGGRKSNIVVGNNTSIRTEDIYNISDISNVNSNNTSSVGAGAQQARADTSNAQVNNQGGPLPVNSKGVPILLSNGYGATQSQNRSQGHRDGGEGSRAASAAAEDPKSTVHQVISRSYYIDPATGCFRRTVLRGFPALTNPSPSSIIEE